MKILKVPIPRCSLGKYWSCDWFCGNFSLTKGLWNQQAANPGVHRLSMTHSGVRQRNLMMHAECPLPVYYSHRPGLCLYQAILFVYWCFCYWPFRDTVPHNSKNLPSVRWIHRSEFLAFIGECNGQTYTNELSTSLTRVFALSWQVTMVGMFYNLRKKFWSGNFRHFKIPMYA